MPDVTITIKGKRKRPAIHHPKKGPLSIRRPNDFLPRRLRKGAVNFYDLGQVWNGSAWKDIDFHKLDDPGNIEVTGTTVNANFDRDGFSTEGAEHYHNLFRSKIFEIDPADWRTTYRKLTYEDAHKYGLRVKSSYGFGGGTDYEVARPEDCIVDVFGNRSGDSSKWKPEGLKVGPLSHFYVDSPQLFWFFDNNPAKYTITNEPSPTADVVEFPALSSNADIFLVPVIVNYLGGVTVTPGVQADWIVSAYAPWSREFWLDRSVANKPLGLFNYGLNQFRSPLDETEAAELLEHLRTKLIPREFAQFSDGSITELSPGDVPSDVAPLRVQVNVNPDGAPAFKAFSTTNGLSSTFNRGRLVGAVRQGGQMYYFWLGGTDASLPTLDRIDGYGTLFEPE